MKKITKLMVAVLALTALLCVSAFAVETVSPNANGAYTVEYTKTAGEYYAILVVEGEYAAGVAPTITEDSIIYISQETADANGKATFAEFKLKENVVGTVYIGGSDLDSAVLYGYTEPVSEGFAVSGTVTGVSAVEANVTLTSTTDAGAEPYTVTTTDGAYTITVPADTYKFVVTKTAHLKHTINAFAVSEDVTGKDFTLYGGDVNASGVIDYVDLNTVISTYNSAGASVEGDINASGVVDYVDLNEVISNYNKAATVE